MTFGFGDELSGLAEKGIAKASQLTGLGSQETAQRVLDTPIEELIAGHRADIQAAQEANPKTFFAGNVVGSLPSAIAIPGSPAAAGAVIGGLNAAGNAEGSIGERALPTAVGATVGAVGGKLMSKIFGGGEAVTQALDKTAGRATRSALGFTRPLIRKLGGAEEANEIASTLVKEGVYKYGLKPENLAKGIDEIKSSSGAQLAQTYEQLSANGQPAANVDDLLTGLSNTLRKRFTRAKEIRGPELQQLGHIEEMAIRRAPDGNYSFKNLWELKQDLGDKAWSKGVQNENLEVFQDAWKLVTDELNHAAKKLAPDLAKSLEQNNKVYNASVQGSKAIIDRMDRLATNKGFGLTDALVAAPFAAHGNLVSAGGAIVAKKLAEEQGAAAAGKAVNKLSEFSQKPLIQRLLDAPRKLGKYAPALQRAAERGPAALSSSWYVLQQTDPEFRQTLKDAEEKENGAK